MVSKNKSKFCPNCSSKDIDSNDKGERIKWYRLVILIIYKMVGNTLNKKINNNENLITQLRSYIRQETLSFCQNYNQS